LPRSTASRLNLFLSLSLSAVAPSRQEQIIQSLGLPGGQPTGQAEFLAQAVVQAMRGAGLLSQRG